MTQLRSGPPVPPQSYWPDRGGERPSSAKPPGWAAGILAGAAAVALLGGGLIAVRNVGGEPATVPPAVRPTLALPSITADRSTPPAAEPTVSDSSADTSGTPAPTSTFPVLKAVPEVCDLLSANLVARLAPKAESEPDTSRDGYGALRKGCGWHQKGRNMKGKVHESRAIMVKVAVWPDVAAAREDAASTFDSMADMAGTKEENPGLKYLSTYGEQKTITAIGDEAHAMYTENLKGTTNAWAVVVIGNATLDIRYFGTDNQNGDILAQGDETVPVPEAELLKGVEEIAKTAADALVK